MLIDTSQAFQCTHPHPARRTWLDAGRLMTCHVCLTCGAETNLSVVADLSDQQPLGSEFERVWDENADKLYEQ